MRKKDAQRFVNQVEVELMKFAESDISYQQMDEMEKAIDEMCTAMERVFCLLGLEDDH